MHKIKTSWIRRLVNTPHPPFERQGPPGRGLALRVVGKLLPATLSGALIRPSLVYPLASFDVSGQWPVYHADASPNEVFSWADGTPAPCKSSRRKIKLRKNNERLPSLEVCLCRVRKTCRGARICDRPLLGKPGPDKKTPISGSLSLSGQINLSGRPDLNRGPLRPERSALTGLSHAPNLQAGIIPVRE